MSEDKPTEPLDLSDFDKIIDLDAPVATPAPQSQQIVVVPTTDTRLAVVEKPARLVELSNLSEGDLSAAKASAAKVDFRRTQTQLDHGGNVMSEIAQASRQLLTGVRLGDAGEVGRIAAAVIDGVKLLHIEDLQAQAASDLSKSKGIVGKIFEVFTAAHSALKGFQENRKHFLTLMDQEMAKARKTQADLSVTISVLEQQTVAIKKSLYRLKIEIAAGQIALDRGHEELEAMRLNAIRTGDAADAAEVMEFRSALANFRGKVAEMRENLVGAALLIPIIGQNKRAAETRMMKISNGLFVVIPRLMAVASQAAVQADIQRAAEESEKLDEAARQITVLASKGAHDAATSAARSLGGDARNIEVLATVADEAIQTMREVIEIEREVAAGDRDREAKLAEIRDRLGKGMRGLPL